MKRRSLAFFFAVIIILSTSVVAYAHTKEGTDGHDQFMAMVLFGSKTYKAQLDANSSQYKALEALENAVALCLDQYNGNYSDELDMLNKMHVHGLPKKVDEINFKGNQHHRKYTHQGWSHTYEIDKAHWETRKIILLQTVNKVFGFQRRAGIWEFLWFEKDYGYSKQCEAFAELLYYIHVLADIEASGMDEGYSDMIKLALPHPQEDSPDIYMELLDILPILFQSPSSNTAYSGLITDINMQAESARAFVASHPNLKECYSDYQQYAKDLLEKLQSKIPYLLKEEDFFKNVFYPSK